jgi:hypothetical protein
MPDWKTALPNSLQTQTATLQMQSRRSRNPPRFKALPNILQLKERPTQGAGDGHILEGAPLPFDAQRHNFFSYRLAIPPFELNQLIKPACGLKQRIGEVKRGHAILCSDRFSIRQRARFSRIDLACTSLPVLTQSTQCSTLRITLHRGRSSERGLPSSQYSFIRCSKPFALCKSNHWLMKFTNWAEFGGIR